MLADESARSTDPEAGPSRSVRMLVVTGIFPPDIGGPATYVPIIAAGLAARHHRITVLTLSSQLNHDDGTYPYRVVRVCRQGPRVWKWLRTALAIIRLGRKVDVLFVNGVAKEAALANLVLRKPMVVKVVGDGAWEIATVRGWVTDGFDDFQKRRYGPRVEALKWLRNWWTRRADRVIANSRYTASWLSHWGIRREKVNVIYNAVESIDGVKPVAYPLKSPVKLVTAGRLVPWKRMGRLIEVTADIEGTALAIIGDGPERGMLEELARALGVADRVYFAGRQSRSAMLSIVASADIFVLNSSWESFAHALLEAMALGIPVISTAIGGPMEVVEDGRSGTFVGLNNQSLADAIRTLAENPQLRRRMGEQGRVIARDKFGVDTMVRRTEQVLMHAAATR